MGSKRVPEKAPEQPSATTLCGQPALDALRGNLRPVVPLVRRSRMVRACEHEAGFRPPRFSPRHALLKALRRERLPSPTAASPESLGYTPRRFRRGMESRATTPGTPTRSRLPTAPSTSPCGEAPTCGTLPGVWRFNPCTAKVQARPSLADGQSPSQVSGALHPLNGHVASGSHPAEPRPYARLPLLGDRHSFHVRGRTFTGHCFERDFSRQKRQAPGYPSARACLLFGTVSVEDSLPSPCGPRSWLSSSPARLFIGRTPRDGHPPVRLSPGRKLPTAARVERSPWDRTPPAGFAPASARHGLSRGVSLSPPFGAAAANAGGHRVERGVLTPLVRSFWPREPPSSWASESPRTQL